MALFMPAMAQLSELDRNGYLARIKLVSEFMNRFNGLESHPDLQDSDSVRTRNYRMLLDLSSDVFSNPEGQKSAIEFIDSIDTFRPKLLFNDGEWFARARCVGSLKGKEVKFDVFLSVEERKADMYKWVISNVDGAVFDLAPYSEKSRVFLLPNENEMDFMVLPELTKGRDEDITLYAPKNWRISPLTAFFTLVYYGDLEIEYVEEVTYTFMQVPGYIFTIREFVRDSSNSGWLISEWFKADAVRKELLKKEIIGGL